MMNSRKEYKLTADRTKGPVEKTFSHLLEYLNAKYYSKAGLRRQVLTVLVARLPEGFSFGENDGDNEILEGGDIEETGVLKVLDVVFIHFCVVEFGHVQVIRVIADAGSGEKYIKQCH